MIQQDYTPEALAVKKAQLRELISAKRDEISRMVDELITPDPATTRQNNLPPPSAAPLLLLTVL